MVHDVIWFLTKGIYDPAWVQVVLNLATLVVLFFYARDNRRLANTSIVTAKTGVDTLNFLKEKAIRAAEKDLATAVDLLLFVEGDLTSLQRTISNGTFAKHKERAVHPEVWPKLLVSIRQEAPDLAEPWAQVGASLLSLDIQIREYFAATEEEQGEIFEEVKRVLAETNMHTKRLSSVWKTSS
jgi:hypothetical protein